MNAEKTLIIGLPNLGLKPESKQIGNQNLLKEVSSLYNQLKEFAESQINIEFGDTNPILEMLANDMDNFNKKIPNFDKIQTKPHKAAGVVDILLTNLTISL
ncbi:MAG: hypothetical protein AB8V03_02315 [Francisella endosymbiont of Hyalomma asiaticum]